MKIGRQDQPDRLFRRHFERLASDAGLAPPQALRRLVQLARRLPGAAGDLRDHFAGRDLDRPILEAVCSVVEKRSAKLLSVLEKSSS